MAGAEDSAPPDGHDGQLAVVGGPHANTSADAMRTGDEAVSQARESDEATLTKLDASRKEKGAHSYYYWQTDVPAGESTVPMPSPELLATELLEVRKEQNAKPISGYSMLDEGEIVKVYVALEGDLHGVASDAIKSEFDPTAILITIATPQALHRLQVAHLAYEIVPTNCKARVTKSRKLVISLEKKETAKKWTHLRAPAGKDTDGNPLAGPRYGAF